MKRLLRVFAGVVAVVVIIVGVAALWAAGWPHLHQPPIVNGVITSADWLKWQEASQKVTKALQSRFPLGSSEDELRTVLQAQGFGSPYRCSDTDTHQLSGGATVRCVQPWDPDHVLEYDWGRFPCSQSISVWWSVNGERQITNIEGHYGGGCI